MTPKTGAATPHEPAITLLLVEAGGFLLGLDAHQVQRAAQLADSASERESLSAARLLGSAAGATRTPRRLTVQVGKEQVPVDVDRVVGTAEPPRGQLCALPLLLRRLGAPAWWLGTLWWQDRLVLLVDLGAAALAAREPP